MPPVLSPRFATLLILAWGLTGCSTVDFSQPELALPARFNEGADIRLTAFEGSAGLTSATEGPALSILQDQLSYGVVRCSRPGPALNLEIRADFASPRDATGPDHLIGVATWRDPTTRQVVGRHHLDVEVTPHGWGRSHVNVSDEADGAGSSAPRGQIAAGEAFVALACEKAFGWSGLPG